MSQLSPTYVSISTPEMVQNIISIYILDKAPPSIAFLRSTYLNTLRLFLMIIR